MAKKDNSGPNILIYDIETAPMLSYVWGLYDQNIGLNQIEKDWHILAWAAKWLTSKDGTTYGPSKKIMYMDQRNEKNIENDKKLLRGIWKLLDKADIVVTQNGKKFDEKRLNARFILNEMQPPSSYKHIDTLQIARSRFDFTSKKLAYMSDKLNTKYKKLSHGKYPGFELWRACLKGDKAAWKEMEEYNRYDVLSLEELYLTLQPWARGANHVNFDLYRDTEEVTCACGSTDFRKNGYAYTSMGKFQRYACKKCGAELRDRKNMLSKDKRKSLKARS